MEINDETYLSMLGDILKSKLEALEDIHSLTKEQEVLLRAETLDEEAFSKIIDEKAELIKKVGGSDDAFTAIYNRISKHIEEYKVNYKEKIIELQKLVSEVSKESVLIEALERKNKSLMEANVITKRQDIKQFKVSKNTADKYYKNMMNSQGETSVFLDKKK
ncbi:MAG: hypothetical protein K6B75_07085 [Lachnospiraceae bacterium]|nr:hypothetical protein [Lachnospiraceae bacterium]